MNIHEYRKLSRAPKKRKYKNTITYVAGKRFDSKKESDRYGELRVLESAGEITELRTQVRIDCSVNGVTICRYFADFQYRHIKRNVLITEDVKSDATRKLPVYRLKKRLVHACTGIEIVEI